MPQLIDTLATNSFEEDARRWDIYQLPRGAKVVDLGGGQLHVWTGPITEIAAEYSEAAGEPRRLVRWAGSKRPIYTLA
jgi:hypothetical protein